MLLNENNFIKLLRKSDTFVINEAFSKVKNANPIAIYEDTKSVIFQDPNDKKFYYATYTISEDTIDLNDVEEFSFDNRNFKQEIKENVENLFSKDYDKYFSKIKNIVKDIIKEDDETHVRIDKKIKDIFKEDKNIFINKPKISVQNATPVKSALNKLRKNPDFHKFITKAEKQTSISVISEEINWDKNNGRIFKNNINFEETKPTNHYSLKGFKKAQINAKKLWKDKNFREHLSEALEYKDKLPVFTEAYKNITLLSEEDMNEMLSKTLFAISESSDISKTLKIILEAINKNENMLHWKMLFEQDPEVAAGAEQATDVSDEAMAGAETGVDAPQATNVTDEPSELPDEEPYDQTAELPDEEELATESTKEIKIINALLNTIEDIFWNGNQENKELANLIKELRDMRVSGSFDEDRLEEIFQDLFGITQQIATNDEEEVPTGEEMPAEEPEEGEEGLETGVDIAGNEEESTGEELPPSPLENY